MEYKQRHESSYSVMAGLVPAIHVFLRPRQKEDVDARVICAKTRFALLPGHDVESAEQKLCASHILGVTS
jgi:hypothetical protein